MLRIQQIIHHQEAVIVYSAYGLEVCHPIVCVKTGKFTK